jgi:hypothetical protein
VLVVIRVSAGRFRLYRGWARPRLWRSLAVGGALALALGSGGCAISSQVDSFFGSDKTDTTGSITPPPGAKEADRLPPEPDLAYARAAVSEVLKRDEKNASQPWENPHSGARGTVTPIASAYTQDGQTCRNFLASYVNDTGEAWLQGEACKPNRGEWEVRSMKRWKSS